MYHGRTSQPPNKGQNEMTVIVTMLDGGKIFPSFDPEHREAIAKFYEDAKRNGEITDYQIA